MSARFIRTLPRSDLMVGGLFALFQYADVMTHSVTHTFRGLYLHSSHLHRHTPGVLSFPGPSAPSWALNPGVFLHGHLLSPHRDGGAGHR